MDDRGAGTSRSKGGAPGGGDAAGPGDKQRTIDTLCEAFANDELEVEEFERRVEVAHRAASGDELRRLLADLPSGRLPVPAREGARVPSAGREVPRVPTVPAESVREWSFSVGLMGGMNRKGHWVAARRNVAVAIMGGCQLDFREAHLPPGVTEVQVLAFWGGVEIIVPPWLDVETSGVGIMGAFEQRHDAAPQAPGGPVLRISGMALMGGVEVSVRLPGESAAEAKRRRRAELKAARLRRRAGER